MPLWEDVVDSLGMVEEVLDGVMRVVVLGEGFGEEVVVTPPSSLSSSWSLSEREETDSSSQESRTSEDFFLPLVLSLGLLGSLEESGEKVSLWAACEECNVGRIGKWLVVLHAFLRGISHC